MIIRYLQEFSKAKTDDLEPLLNQFITRNQIGYLIEQLIEKGILEKERQFKGTAYFKGEKMIENSKVLSRAVRLG